MIIDKQDIHNRLYKIYIKYCRLYNNKDYKEMACMWSLIDLPDEIHDCDQIYDIEKEFNFSFGEFETLDLYDMTFDDAINFIIEKIKR